MNPHSGFEVDPDLLPMDGDVVDGLKIGHTVEEGVWLAAGSAIWNRAQGLRKRKGLGGEIQFRAAAEAQEPDSEVALA